MNRLEVSTLAVAGIILVTAVLTLPALPVDETRYLTVAWEMRVTGNWILPSLNFEPYSHKPPLLFWLINASWSIFGVEVWSARLVGIAATITVVLLSNRLEKKLNGDRAPGHAYSALMLLGLPLFVAFGCSIMFDMLLTATVSGAMLALWIAGRSGGWKPFVAYGASVGLGLLAKGPVVLVFTAPAAAFAFLWIAPNQRRQWYLRIGVSLVLALSIGLIWALAAARAGGSDYAHMIFWEQSAGRIASSFAHARPFWFYVPILLLFCIPLLIWRPARRGWIRSTRRQTAARNFLLCWILPALAILSAISGKQIHYLLPLLPACVLLASLALDHTIPQKADRIALAVLFAGIPWVLIAAAIFTPRIVEIDPAIMVSLSVLNVGVLVAAGLAAILAIAAFRRTLVGLAVANCLVVGALAVEFRTTVGPLFDLQPVADVLRRLNGRPIAVAQKTRGEFGFLARLTRPVVLVPESEISEWASRHPDGVLVMRSKRSAISSYEPEQLLLQKNYRFTEAITIRAVR